MRSTQNNKKSSTNSKTTETNYLKITKESLEIPIFKYNTSIEDYIKIHPNLSEIILKKYFSELKPLPQLPQETAHWTRIGFSNTNSSFIEIIEEYPPAAMQEGPDYFFDEAENDNNNQIPLSKRNSKTTIAKLEKVFIEGFKFGYENFIPHIVSPPNALSNSVESKIARVLNFLYPASNGSSSDFGQKEVNLNHYTDGMDAGYRYYAWYFIFENDKLFEPYFKKFEKGKSATDKEAFSFELIANISTIDCFNSLVKNKFITKTSDYRVFDKIFSAKKVETRIDWIGTLPELARFVFLLHNGDKSSEMPPVCVKNKKVWIIASQCLTLDGNEIVPSAIQNNNRELKNIKRKESLINAIKHLQKPKPTTKNTSHVVKNPM